LFPPFTPSLSPDLKKNFFKSLSEKIEAAGLSPKVQVPEHLKYVTSYAEQYVEGESDLSEWEDVEDEESEASDESFD
jgi:hypothetical protein